MLIRYSLIAILAASCAAAASPSFAQDDTKVDMTVTKVAPKPVKKRRVVRNVEPISYWVDADKLRVRDNPIAGDVVGILELGKKVRAYQSFANWIRISPSDKPQQWVNVKFISPQQISYANFNAGRRTASKGFVTNRIPVDVDLKRIKVKDYDGGRVFAASVAEASNRNRVVVTKTEFRAGPYFEKRLVACDGDAATHAQLIGEGYTYLMMEYDKRTETVDVSSDLPSREISDKTSALTSAIAEYACETDL